jgi:proline dehydrogenase
MLPEFKNTEIAFRHKSNKELKHAFWLFKIMGFSWLVKIGQQFLNVAFFLKLPVKGIVKATIFKQFIGGENLKECEKTMDVLFDNFKVGSILDYSAEGNSSEAYFDKCRDRVIETIALSKIKEAIPFSVFKITGIARFELLEKIQNHETLSEEENQEWKGVKNRALSICKAAFDSQTPIFIDAEESWIQNTIDELAEELMQQFNREKAIVYNTVQLYRKDRLNFLKTAHQKAITNDYFLGLKIVRGAYMEKERARATLLNLESPIHENKNLSDSHYNDALRYCTENYKTIAFCAGTHNEDSCLFLCKLMDEQQIPTNCRTIFFAQLLGMSDHISFNLINYQYNVAKYVPFGPVKKVIPYLSRRAQENTSVQGQMGRELKLIRMEIQRRKTAK